MRSKRIFDLILAAFLCPILVPLLFFLAILIVIFDHSNPLFLQDRIGLGGRVFKIIKFRTMRSSDQFFIREVGAGVVNEGDIRVTKLGYILRKFSLDELPQIINVINGTMSFVGPRAAMVGEMEGHNFDQAHIKKRCAIKPGITGLAQINGRNELIWKDKMALDLAYCEIQNKRFNLLKDLQIILRTVAIVISARGVVEKYNRDNLK